MGLENNRHLAAIGILEDAAIERRVDAIKKISNRIRRLSTQNDLLAAANRVVVALTQSTIDEQETQALLKILEKAVPSFIYAEGKANELSVLYVLGVAEAINVGPGVAAANMTLLATAAYSGLEYLAPLGDPAREDIRQDILSACLQKSEAEQSRNREEIPGVDGDNVLEVIGRLARNAARDREEIDLLWWVINDRSQLADVRLSETDTDVAAVLSALETSAILIGPGHRAHRDIATHHLRDPGTVRTPVEFAAATTSARDWARHALHGSLAIIGSHESVLPALSIVVMERDQAIPEAAAGGHTYSILDWCRRLVDEIGLLLRLRHTIRLSPAA